MADRLNALEDVLKRSFEDQRLSGEERNDLTQLALSCTESEKRFLKNRAFDEYRQFLFSHDFTDSTVSGNDAAEKSKTALLGGMKWLEKTLKALDPVEPLLPDSTAHFSPGAECLEKIIGLCRSAKKSLDICVFTLSDNRLTDAILGAAARKVEVRIITDNDKSADRGSDIDYLIDRRVPVRMDASPYHMHHKFALIDNSQLINGSFNWTRSASERNQENIVITYDPKLVLIFKERFESLWETYS